MGDRQAYLDELQREADALKNTILSQYHNDRADQRQIAAAWETVKAAVMLAEMAVKKG